MPILVVEDETKLAAALREGLEADHYSVTRCTGEGFFLVHAQAFDLVILDVMLPGRTVSKFWPRCAARATLRRSCC